VNVVPGSGDWSDIECMAFAIRSNMERRSLSPEQKKYIRGQQKLIAAGLREQGKTQAEVAYMLGVSRRTVDEWEGGHTVNYDNVSYPDCRIKIPGKEFQPIAERVAKGERQEQVAADYGVVPRTSPPRELC
jgi:hypothetical protein